jgi:signal transduction histidine kinase
MSFENQAGHDAGERQSRRPFYGSEEQSEPPPVIAAIRDATTLDEVFEAVVDRAALRLGASSAGLWLFEGAANTLRLVRNVGGPQGRLAQEQSLGLAGSTAEQPVLEAIGTGEPLWLDSREELLARYPQLAEAQPPDGPHRVAVLPLVGQERALGAVQFTLPAVSRLDDPQRAFLLLVARRSVEALERLRSPEPILAAPPSATARDSTDAGLRAELLYGLARTIVEASGVDAVFAAALSAIERALQTDRASILVFDEAGVMRFRAWHGLDEAYRSAVEGHSPWLRDVQGPTAIVVPDVEADPSLVDYLPLFRHHGIAALAFIPLVAGGRLIGKFMVYYERPRTLSAQELEVAQAVANHVAAEIVRFTTLAELQRAVKLNEMFTAVLGHDLRGPLNAIVASAELALLQSADERQMKPLSRIVSSGARMARMIDQLLDLTRVRIGKGIPLDLQRTDLSLLLEQVLEETRSANPEWSLRFGPVADVEGDWDADRLSQVFSNLLGNAVQHGSPEHGIDVRIHSDDPLAVRVEVHNAGVIPAELVPHLFEAMSASERHRGKARGLGLGLFISSQIAQAHGGRIEVCSSPSEGTTFAVWLPRSGAR